MFFKMLYNKWWRKGGSEGGSTNMCPKVNNDPSKASALNVVNIGGVFVVLLCGLSFAILVSIAEFCWRYWRDAELYPPQQDKTADSLTLKDRFYQGMCLAVSAGQSEEGQNGSKCDSCENLKSEGHDIKYI